MTSEKRYVVMRHDAPFRILHWAIFAEGVLLTLTGLQLGGFANIVVLTSGDLTVHIVTGVVFILTALLFLFEIIQSRDYRWVALRRIPLSLKYIITETKAWFSLGPKPRDPIAYDKDKGQYVEKLIPSVIIVFWTFILLGAILALTGLAMAFPAQFGFVYAVTDPIGSLLTGVTGLAFMLVLHRLMTFLLIALVAAHVYASFVFKLVRSVIIGKRGERVVTQTPVSPADAKG